MSNEYVAGRNAVIEAIRSGRNMNKIYIAEGANKGQMHKLLDLANKNKIIVQTIPKKKLDSLADTSSHQGVVAQVAAYEYAALEDLFTVAESRKEAPFFLLLDELADPHNLGSIMRTAEATGVHGIIIPKRRSVGLTQTVAKASAGAIEYIPVVRVTNLTQTIQELKDKGMWIAGTDAAGTDNYRNLDGNLGLGLVIGSEGKGISRLVRESCDFLVQIPMAGKITSLNASVAAALLMYEVYNKRSAGSEQ